MIRPARQPAGRTRLRRMPRPRVLSGIQPTADSFHIGNYLGALRQWVALQDTHDAFYCVVDLHAITVEQDPAQLRRRTRVAAAQLLAAGLDPERSTLFVQSHVPEHAELAWVLDCITGFGEASRMTQFKDKSAKRGADACQRRAVHLPDPAGRRHPALPRRPGAGRRGPAPAPGADPGPRAAVQRPVRADVRGAGPYILKEAAKITDLQDPTVKMSKSASSPQGIIDLLEDPGRSGARSCGRSPTPTARSATTRRPSRASPTCCDLLGADRRADRRPRGALRGRGLRRPKKDLAEVVVDAFAPIRERTEKLLADEAELDRLLAEGAARRTPLARPRWPACATGSGSCRPRPGTGPLAVTARLGRAA